VETKDAPLWLEWAREIQALSQTSTYYAENHFQLERYQRLSEIAAQIIQQYSNLESENLLAIFSAQAGYATPKVDVRGAVFRDNNLRLFLTSVFLMIRYPVTIAAYLLFGLSQRET
jgi:hypothetical protein